MQNDNLSCSINEAARLLGVSRSSIVKRLADGTLKSVKFGNRVLIPRSALEELLKTS